MAKKFKTNIKIKGPGEYILKASVLTDENILKLMRASEISGVPISLQGKQIEHIEINNMPLTGSHKLIIGPPLTYFNIKIGEKIYKKIPFTRKKLSEDTLLFTTNSQDMGIKIKIKLKFIENVKVNIDLTLSALSDEIKDILYFEKRKKEWYDKHFEMKINEIDETIVEGDFNFIEYNDNLIDFYKKVNYINQNLNLNLKQPKNYTITNNDLISINDICYFLRYKKIPFKTCTININVTHSKLEYIIMNERKKFYFTNKYSTKLLNNYIHLGKYKVDISEVVYLNFKDLLEIYHKNQKEKNNIDIELIIRSIKPDENYLIF